MLRRARGALHQPAHRSCAVGRCLIVFGGPRGALRTRAVAARELQLDPDLAQASIPPVIQAIDPDDLGGFTEEGLKLQIANDEQTAQGNVTVTDVDQLTDVTLLRQAEQELGVPCKSGYKCP